MKVGDVVYRPRWHGNAKAFNYDELTITAIGRKWVQTNRKHVRFDKETLRVDGAGYGNPSDVYFSREDHAREVSLSKAWLDFYVKIRDTRLVPPGMTVEKIAEARRVLGMGEGS